MTKKKTEKIFFYVLFFLLVLGVSSLFYPSPIDDLGWATDLGEDMLKKNFEGYNGRYLGNFFAIVLMKNTYLIPFIKSLSVTGILFFTQKFTQNESRGFLYFTAFMLVIPSPLFIKGFVWNSAFINYYLSAFIMMANFYLLFFKINLSKTQSFFKIIFLLIFGIAAQLFVEIFSIFSLLISIFAIIFFTVKHKKFDVSSVVFFIACAIGLAIMFSNSAYADIVKGNDSYRDVAIASNSVFSTVLSWVNKLLGEVSYYFLTSCFPIIIAVIALCIFIQRRKKLLSHRNILALKKISAVCALVCVIASVIILLGDYEKQNIKIVIGFLLIPFIMFCVFIFTKLSDKEKVKRIFLFLGMITVQVTPFILISPIGHRCFVGVFILMILIAKELFTEIDAYKKLFKKLFIIAFALTMLLNFICYSVLCFSYKNKLETIRQEVGNGNYNITLEHTTFGFMMYGADSEVVWDIWTERFCRYYSLPQNITIEYK